MKRFAWALVAVMLLGEGSGAAAAPTRVSWSRSGVQIAATVDVRAGGGRVELAGRVEHAAPFTADGCWIVARPAAGLDVLAWRERAPSRPAAPSPLDCRVTLELEPGRWTVRAWLGSREAARSRLELKAGGGARIRAVRRGAGVHVWREQDFRPSVIQGKEYYSGPATIEGELVAGGVLQHSARRGMSAMFSSGWSRPAGVPALISSSGPEASTGYAAAGRAFSAERLYLAGARPGTYRFYVDAELAVAAWSPATGPAGKAGYLLLATVDG